jgi:hypothetical protein
MKRCVAVGLMGLAGAIPIAANAQAVTYDFTGVVISVAGPAAPAVGSSVTGTFTLNPAYALSTSGSVPSPNGWSMGTAAGTYFGVTPPSGVLFSTTLQFGTASYNTGPPGTFITNDSASFSGGSEFAFSEEQAVDNADYNSSAIQFTNGVLPAQPNGYPGSAPSITPSSNAEGYVEQVANGQYVYFVDFEVTSVTAASNQTSSSSATGGDGPIPVWALGALGAGLCGLASRRRDRAS